MNLLVLYSIKFYRKIISPLMPQRCRFYPSCSEYFLESVMKYGWWKGCWKGIHRLSRCHPFHRGGYDPVK